MEMCVKKRRGNEIGLAPAAQMLRVFSNTALNLAKATPRGRYAIAEKIRPLALSNRGRPPA